LTQVIRTLTEQQVQWLEEDHRVETPVSTAPSYHSQFHLDRTSYLTPAQAQGLTDERDIPRLTLVEEDDDFSRASSPRIPRPGEYPGPEWRRNWDEDTQTPIYNEVIRQGPIEVVATFFRYDMDTSSPELLLTMGRHCVVHSRFLHARADPYPRPALTRKQLFSFSDSQPFTKLVDWALQEEADDTLRAEVSRY
jgi:hypothetical protein